MLSIFFTIPILAYILLSGFFFLGLWRNRKSNSHFEPPVSIVVAFRDEEKTLAACLESLSLLDYPKEKLDIVLVDDNSHDNSPDIARSFAEQHDCFQVVSLDHGSKIKPGKAGAVLEGIEKTTGEVIFLTDADCSVSQTWIRGLLSQFTPEVGMVGGFTILEEGKNKTKFGSVQTLDWIYLLSVASGAAAMGLPLSWVGNNLAFRRCAYDQVGGYRELGNSLIEDFALLHAIDQKTNWKIRFHCSFNTVVYSQPELPYHRFYQQRKRWAAGITEVKLFGKFLILIGCLTHGLVGLSLFMQGMWQWSLISLLSTLASDLLLLGPVAVKLHQSSRLLFFLGFELHYYVYTTLLAVVGLLDRKIVWKGTEYTFSPKEKSNASNFSA